MEFKKFIILLVFSCLLLFFVEAQEPSPSPIPDSSISSSPTQFPSSSSPESAPSAFSSSPTANEAESPQIFW
ncbi:conserved hypothetical protein [Ricinus communis]|uniref:Uncharacterized protein n=1 Tax=Ricinus communis TaxID=3988 RepID=B9S1G4_RICCO|nr:conserved hypothetical protein [Ricinus communis]